MSNVGMRYSLSELISIMSSLSLTGASREAAVTCPLLRDGKFVLSLAKGARAKDDVDGLKTLRFAWHGEPTAGRAIDFDREREEVRTGFEDPALGVKVAGLGADVVGVLAPLEWLAAVVIPFACFCFATVDDEGS